MRRLNLDQIKTPDEFVGVMDALDHYVRTLPEDERPRRFPCVKAVLDRMETAFLERVGEVPSTDLTDEEMSKLPVLSDHTLDGFGVGENSHG